jgi:magnesium chelatase family protein
MTSDTLEEDSSIIRERVIKARAIQADRYKGKSGIYTNAQMTTQQLRKYCKIEHTKSVELEDTMKKNHLSARAYDRILKVSRTIADLAGSEQISFNHFAEAVRYRCLDKEGWGTKHTTTKN